jgi:NAD(P)H-hydrate epimerase
MREVDRIMVDELHIELLQMMENVGRCLAAPTRTWLSGELTGRHVVVLAGSGGNGGGGLVAARRLTIWGASASVVLGLPRDAVCRVTAHQLDILNRLGVPLGPGFRSHDQGRDDADPGPSQDRDGAPCCAGVGR